MIMVLALHSLTELSTSSEPVGLGQQGAGRGLQFLLQRSEGGECHCHLFPM